MGSLSNNIAKHLKEVHIGGNWTCQDLQKVLADVSVDEANKQIKNLNTIATLAFHIHYYFREVLKVLEGEKLNASDKESLQTPLFDTEEKWDQFKATIIATGEAFSKKVEDLDDETIWETFQEEKYGTYFRNLIGINEHTHYHLGQISLIKKLIRS